MQPNVITLTVDETNDGGITPDVEYAYERFDTFNSRSVYYGNDYQPDMRRMLGFYRTPAKANGLFRGTQKSAFKFTTDIQVTGSDGVSIVTAPIIYEVSASVPLGATDAQVILEQQKVVAMLTHATVPVNLNVDLSI